MVLKDGNNYRITYLGNIILYTFLMDTLFFVSILLVFIITSLYLVSVDIRVSACRGKNEKYISVIYTVYMESGKKILGYAREIAYFSKTVLRKEIRHSGFYALCAVFVMFP